MGQGVLSTARTSDSRVSLTKSTVIGSNNKAGERRHLVGSSSAVDNYYRVNGNRSFTQWIFALIIEPILSLLQKVITFLTGKGELERRVLQYNRNLSRNIAPDAAENIKLLKQIEHAILKSKHLLPFSKRLLRNSENEAQETLIQIITDNETIKDDVSFAVGMGAALNGLHSVNMAVAYVDRMCGTPYDSSNPSHEEKLERLWQLYRPEVRRDGRITKQWDELGFQGDDPATDFRGLGVFGLDNLLYIPSAYPNVAKKMLNESHHPTMWYSFAITGLNITAWMRGWMNTREAGKIGDFFFNMPNDTHTHQTFETLYTYTFYKFHLFWFEKKPKSVMEFPIVASEFKKKLTFPHNIQAVRTQLAQMERAAGRKATGSLTRGPSTL
eukprot:GDKI01014342.1.p1 GENE.GDKI01014342.1~~GDKI01014342.1.p1  ORF type:complete len:384 (+),score=86.92 GDKI01014342.1:63-1214(+)